MGITTIVLHSNSPIFLVDHMMGLAAICTQKSPSPTKNPFT